MSGTTSTSATGTPGMGTGAGASGAREAQLTRLYDTVFDRAPDSEGLAFWTNALNSGITLDTVADLLVASQEFQSRNGTLSNAEFVSLLYRNGLEREADAAGRDFWTGGLQRGAVDRGGVALALSESAEGLASPTPGTGQQGTVTATGTTGTGAGTGTAGTDQQGTDTDTDTDTGTGTTSTGTVQQTSGQQDADQQGTDEQATVDGTGTTGTQPTGQQAAADGTGDGAQTSGTQTSPGQQTTTGQQGTADGTGTTGTQTSTGQQGEGQQNSSGGPTNQQATADGSGASPTNASSDIFTFNRFSGNDQLHGYQPELDRILLDGFSPREVVMNEGEANGREYIDITAGGLAGTGSDAIHIRVWDVANHSDIHLVFG